MAETTWIIDFLFLMSFRSYIHHRRILVPSLGLKFKVVIYRDIDPFAEQICGNGL